MQVRLLCSQVNSCMVLLKDTTPHLKLVYTWVDSKGNLSIDSLYEWEILSLSCLGIHNSTRLVPIPLLFIHTVKAVLTSNDRKRMAKSGFLSSGSHFVWRLSTQCYRQDNFFWANKQLLEFWVELSQFTEIQILCNGYEDWPVEIIISFSGEEMVTGWERWTPTL